ncbi:putative lipid II flippase FtsW [Geopsychrobacter electrodiphilus]|uniref:putative lipid II flippase FtsW n=1 Tax=Geopsychrobacter electrodiphilus TaxID=225196 RepID=UPI000371F432|nr:putative lipid II flippase FtsW [Geopsychrobacter electrodiphilus]
MRLHRDFDTTLLLLAVALTCLGVVMVFSSSCVVAGEKYGDAFFFLKKQLKFALVGGLLMALTMYVDYEFWRKIAIPLLLLGICLLALLFVPGMGVTAGGAARWLRLPGITVQPAEFVKLGLVLYLASSMTRKKEKIRSFKLGLLPYILVLGAILGLLLLQPDLGSAMIISGVALTMLLMAGARWSFVVPLVLSVLPAVYFMIMHVDYRRRRILAFLNPWKDPYDTGFQIIQSMIAFGSGGVFGKGLGGSEQKLFFLPEAHTDFIFSVIGEELGLIGVLAVSGIFLLLVLRGLRIAWYATDPFARYLAFGLTLLLGMEAFVNMAVCLGLLPTKGLALPFISYGGTSLIASLVAVGILLNISSRIEVPQ